MNKVLKILVLLTTLAFTNEALSQSPITPNRRGFWTKPNVSYGEIRERISVGKVLLFPTGCGAPDSLYATDLGQAAIYFDSCGSTLYRYNPKVHTWGAVGAGGGSTLPYNGDTSFYLAGDSALHEFAVLTVHDTCCGVSHISNDTLFVVGGGSEATDTTSLSDRINLKLNISDTAAMLNPYLRKIDTASLSNRINLKLNVNDTAVMLLPYLRKIDTTSMLSPYMRSNSGTPLSFKTSLDALNGIIKGDGAGTYSVITDNSSNWNTAFSWGNHASAGYELQSNKATTFGIVNNTLYPTTQAIVDYFNDINPVLAVLGTANRITSSGGTAPIIDISSSYVGQSSITTLGTVTTGTWNGSAIGDTYISSASTWNSKEPAQSGTGYVKSAAGIKSYVTSIPNADLTNSTITINSTSTALGSSIDTRPAIVELGSNQTSTSISMAGVTGLSIAVAAGKRYRLSGTILTTCDNTGGVKLGLSITGSPALKGGSILGNIGATNANRLAEISALDGTNQGTFNTVAASAVEEINCTFIAGSAGTAQLTFAAVTGGQTATVRAGTTLILTQMQ